MTIEALKERKENLKTLIIASQAQKETYLQEITDLQNKMKSAVDRNETLNKYIAVYTEAAKVSRDNARQHFEKIITDALQFITQNQDYEFVIEEMTGRQKASYEFYIKSTVNGVECKQKPEDANGGGFVDIISTAMKYAYLEIFNDPKIMSATLLYDEPAKMVSEQMSVKYAEYIRFLGQHYGRQTIMITHNDNLAHVADKTFVVMKDRSGISHANEPLPGAIDFKDMEDLYEAEN